MTFEKMKDLLIFRRIVKWNDNTIELDNGITISIEETEYSCCASAQGTFTSVVLDAAITAVNPIEYRAWEDEDTYGCCARVTIMHNQNLICSAYADADAGNGGYYYSIASFVISMPGLDKKEYVEFVSSDDGTENESPIKEQWHNDDVNEMGKCFE